MNPSLVYAFGVGMVATFNPCGFAMLPAYLSYFLGLEGAEHADDLDTGRAVVRALKVGAVMTAGFVVVFGVLGILLEPVLNRVADRLPWLTIVLGIVLVGLGIFMLTGRTITVRLPKLNKGTDSRELTSVFLFGISYALVSLSCTFALFTAAVSTTIDDQSVLVGIGAFIAYALGMGLVLMVLTLAIALARQSLVRRLRGVLPYVNRVSGALLRARRRLRRLLRLVRAAGLRRRHQQRWRGPVDVRPQRPHDRLDRLRRADPRRAGARPGHRPGRADRAGPQGGDRPPPRVAPGRR